MEEEGVRRDPFFIYRCVHISLRSLNECCIGLHVYAPTRTCMSFLATKLTHNNNNAQQKATYNQ